MGRDAVGIKLELLSKTKLVLPLLMKKYERSQMVKFVY